MSKSKGSPALREENIRKARALWQERQDAKRAIAARNAAETSAMTPAQRWRRLDERLGSGVGAARERARLTRLMGV